MHKGIIVAGFGAIGKTTLASKYNNCIDLESSYYKWDNTGFEHLSPEEMKGIVRPLNKEWPSNYHQAIIDSRENYDIILTSMHDHVLKFLENNNIEYFLAFPTLDSAKTIEERCYARGNNKDFTETLIIALYELNQKLNEYHPQKVLRINKNEYLEDALRKEKML